MSDDVDTSSMERFRLNNQGQYGGGSELEHRFGDCNWSPGVDDMNPLEVLALAREHAATCDGSRQLFRTPTAVSPTGSLMADLWSSALERQLRAVSLIAPGTDAPGA